MRYPYKNFHAVPGTDKEDPNIPDQDPTFCVTLESDPDPDPGPLYGMTNYSISVPISSVPGPQDP
jgi:hypothetical protein